MSELTLTLLRLGYLVLLWMLVLSVAAVIRRDIYGTRITRRDTGSGTRRPRQSAAAAPAAPAGPRLLVVTEGSLQGTTLSLGQAPVLIGRAPECTLVLDDDYASSRHARLFPTDTGWMVEDLGSTNGTFLGRQRVEGQMRIDPGSAVRVGRTVLELRR